MPTRKKFQPMEITIKREDFERAVPAFRSPTPEVWNKVQRYVEGCTANWQALITTDATLPDHVAASLVTAICLRAAYDAVPQMDLVLTPTGFGIVSNQNTAPASRERVDALRLQLRRDACQLEDGVLLYLAAHNLMTMLRSRAGSLLWTPSLCTLYGVRTPEGREVLREEFDAMATTLHAASARVVDVISPELYAALVTRQYAADAAPTPDPSPKESAYAEVQEWEGKTGTQNTFFHIFNHLFRNGKRIILACDRPPVELKGMNERLITRFSSGLIAEMEKPNVQLCADILRRQIKHDGLNIPEDVIEFIASTANGSVRELQGVINSLMAYSVVYNCDIDMQLAQRIIKRSVKVNEEPLTIDEIIESVCQHYNVTTANVNSRSRKKEYVMARQVSIYLAQKYTKLSASRIGRMVGGRDHATVIYSCNQVEQRIKIDKKFSSEISSIENSFKMKN